MRPNPSPAGLTIGRLSARTGVHIETIRYYEKVKLLAKPERTTGGYRLYTPAHAQSLSFIRRGRELGFALGAIRDLMVLSGSGACCEKARAVTIRHRDEVRRKLSDLRRLDRALSALVRDCQPERWPHCPIVEALSGRA